MLTLYHHDMSVCASKVRFVLAEKGLAYRSRILDLGRGDQHGPDYARLNPKQVVPTLIHDGQAIIESNVICEYLDDAFPSPALRPAGALERARMRLWMKQLDEDVHECTSVLSFAIALRHMLLRKPPAELEAHIASMPNPQRRERMRDVIFNGTDAAHVAAAILRFETLLTAIEASLHGSDWLAGDSFSLADIGIIPYIARLDHLQLDFMWDERPKLAAWYARIASRPAYAVSHSDWFDGAKPFVEMMRDKGREARPSVERVLADAGRGQA